ncbi:MAG: cytochrome b/b6 domain-containing protein, partial [Anaeromyxobacteraceae bacterium]
MIAAPRPPEHGNLTGGEIRVWDVPVRAVHWAQAALVVISVATGFTGGNALRIHRRSGYALLVLVVFRVLWGFLGGRHARFAAFLRGPRAVVAFVRDTAAARRPACAGHNPLAGWMVLALLAVLLVQGATGLFANDDIAFEGPLAAVVSKAVSDLLTSMHRTDAILLLALVAMHLGAVLFHVVVERRNPVPAMFTGRKRWTGGLDAPEPGPSSTWLAAALFVA